MHLSQSHKRTCLNDAHLRLKRCYNDATGTMYYTTKHFTYRKILLNFIKDQGEGSRRVVYPSAGKQNTFSGSELVKTASAFPKPKVAGFVFYYGSPT